MFPTVFSNDNIVLLFDPQGSFGINDGVRERTLESSNALIDNSTTHVNVIGKYCGATFVSIAILHESKENRNEIVCARHRKLSITIRL